MFHGIYVHNMRIMSRMSNPPKPWRSSFDLGREIRDWMRQHGRTQVAVADRLDVDQSQVSRVLRGDFSRRSEVAKRLLAFAKISPEADGRAESAESSLLSALRRRTHASSRDVTASRDLDRVLNEWEKQEQSAQTSRGKPRTTRGRRQAQ